MTKPLGHKSGMGLALICLALCLAQPISAQTSPELEMHLLPGVLIQGPVGSRQNLQFTANVADTNSWQTLTNLYLESEAQWVVDFTATNAPKRFYRSVTDTNSNAFVFDTNYLVWISAGSFLMGSPDSEPDRYSFEGPQTQVTISHGFWIGKHELSQRIYQGIMGENPSRFTGDLDKPVDQMSWYAASNFCALLTDKARQRSLLPAGYVFRLPTEAEWEYVCRAGTTTRFSYGDDPTYTALGQYAWFTGNSYVTHSPNYAYMIINGKFYSSHECASKLPNAWGVFDMHGGMWEWCADYFADHLNGGTATDPSGPATGQQRSVRGGSWYREGAACRSALRVGQDPQGQYSDYSFRPVLAPPLP